VRQFILGALLAFGTAVAANAQQWCPVGSFPWVDSWGNQICKALVTEQTTTIQGNLGNCSQKFMTAERRAMLSSSTRRIVFGRKGSN